MPTRRRPIRCFFGIRGDLEKLTLATYFAQLCCELIPENEPAAEELRLMLNTLYCLGGTSCRRCS